MIRPFRISIILSLLSSAFWAASGIALKSDQSLYLDPTPLQLADDMKSNGQWEDVLLLTAFSEKYLSQDDPGRRAGLQHVYVYNDKGCDCAKENRPIEFYLNSQPADIHQVKKCSASCCGDEGILLKKFEEKSNL